MKLLENLKNIIWLINTKLMRMISSSFGCTRSRQGAPDWCYRPVLAVSPFVIFTHQKLIV